MRYFIVGYPKMYNMLHGICDYRIEEVEYEEACKIGKHLSRETIEIFCRPEEEWYSRVNYREDNDVAEWNDVYEQKYKEELNKIIEDEIAYQVWPVEDWVSAETIRLWANSEDDVNVFIKRYCLTK